MSSAPRRGVPTKPGHKLGRAKLGHEVLGHANGNGVRNAETRSTRSALSFALYVEGPRDRSLLEAWAQRVSPALADALAEITVILGGCRPARAAEHLRELRARDAAARGLCVLDRDVEGAPRPPAVDEPGLELFTWSRRHIESYLLVPAAIQRSLRLHEADARVARFFDRALPRSEAALGVVDAKPLFAFQGELQQLLGRPVRPAQVARAMFAGEIHADVRALLARVREGVGLDS